MPAEEARSRRVLADSNELGQLSVDREAFREFERWIGRELEELERQWSHLAVPRAWGKQAVVPSRES